MTSFHIRVLLRSLTHHTLGYDVTSGTIVLYMLLPLDKVMRSQQKNSHYLIKTEVTLSMVMLTLKTKGN